MINLKDYISNGNVTDVNEWNTQIQPDLTHASATMAVDYDNKQNITSNKDKIHVEFDYYGEHVNHDIKYKDISKYDDNTRWKTEIKSKKHINIKYEITGQTTDTGRYGITIIDMKVFVKINNIIDTTIVPKCNIISDPKFPQVVSKETNVL